ncbi:MAG: protein TolR [Bdellovibrionales bacterium CG10_big_fil_rev_8_21_14_0_10_45_34]|nr:MAG: protein TolR [Bdellovibrionales bacterium CG10_big_fil_rev_8_21_14_0_10_45_34]
MGMSASGGGKSRVTINEINVTPLVDVMLVLLIIFMVTAPMMQQGIEVDLPETANTGVTVNDEPFVLVVQSNGRILAGEAHIEIGQLRKKLAAIFATRKNKQVYLQADRKVDYGVVAEVMGEIKSAGISQIGLITLPKTDL